MKTEILLKTVNIPADCDVTIAVAHQNRYVGRTADLETKIQLKTADILVNCNIIPAAIAEVGLFHLIFRSVFTFVLVKIITE